MLFGKFLTNLCFGHLTSRLIGTFLSSVGFGNLLTSNF